MSKNGSLKTQQRQEEAFDFSDMMSDSGEEEVMLGMMSGLIEASRHQSQMAMELTKIIVENNPQFIDERSRYTVNISTSLTNYSV